MDRAELERLDRESLVLRAQAAGIKRARVLTRPELIDELLRLDPANHDPSQLKRTRGFFGIARDLLSRVVERGLHLPDAAERLRAALGTSSPMPDVPRPEPQAVPTVTLAEIYAAQGHRTRAIDTLKRVLDAEPEHGTARALLERLEAADYVAPRRPLPPEPEVAVDDLPLAPEIGANLGTNAEVASLLEELETNELSPPAPTPPRVDDEGEEDEEDEEDEEEDEASLAPTLIFDSVAAAEASAPEAEENEEEDDDEEEEPPTLSEEIETPRSSFREPPTLPRADTVAEASVQQQPPVDEEILPASECVAIPLGRGGATYIWWKISSPSTKRHLGRFVVRTFVVLPHWDGPEVAIRDVPCAMDAGELVLQGLPERAIVRIAVGFQKAHSKEFIPVAHSPAIEIARQQHGGGQPQLVEWTVDHGLNAIRPDGPIADIAQAAARVVRAAVT